MKAKVKRGSGFRGTLNYVLDEGKKRTGDKNAIIVAGNMSSNNAKDLAREFRFSRELRTDVKNPVWHCSLGLPKGESIGIDTWDRLSRRFLEEMNISVDKHQHIVVKHHDTDNEHVHIVMSRIGIDGNLWHGRNDVMHAIEATQKLEKEFGLTLTAGYFELDANGKKVRRKKAKKTPTFEEIQMSARSDLSPSRLDLQNMVAEASKTKTDIFDFIEQLEAGGVTVRPNVAKTGRLNGFSFEYGGIAFKGSELGDDFKWSKDSKLKQNVIYEQNSQGARLITIANTAKQSANKQSEDATSKEETRRATHSKNDGADRKQHVEARSELAKPLEIGGASKQPDRKQHEASGPDNRKRNEADQDSNNKTRIGNVEHIENQVTARLESQVNQLRTRAGTWNAVNSTVDALAAPLAEDTQRSKSSPDHVRKLEAWRSQHEALNAPEYRITLIPRKESGRPWVLGKKAGGEDFFKPDEVEAKLPLLRQKNAQGYDIYITPIDEANHYIVVDDLTTQQHMAMMKAGYKPTLVQESSKDNRQAIFKIPKGGDDEQQAANNVVVSLNREYGDKNFSGVVHPFRMAGFSNKKAGRNNAFTRILSRSLEACVKVSETLKQAVETLATSRAAQSVASRLKGMGDYPQFSIDAESSFKREWSKVHGLATKKGWNIDYSRIDFQAAKATLEAGVNPDELQQAILDCSPSVLDRKNNPEDYAQRTVAKAQAEAKPPAPTKPEPPAPKPKPKRDKNGTLIIDTDAKK